MILGKLAFAISSLMNLANLLGVGIGALAGPIGIAIAAIVAIIAIGVLLYKNWDTIKAKALELWNRIKTTFNGIKASITASINSVKTFLSNAWNAIRSRAASAFNSIKNAITQPIETAKNTIKGIIDKIKGFFPISIGKILSNISVPHFSLKWSSKDFGPLGSIRYPTGFDVSWYAKGGIFNSPTIAGIGEIPGGEAVVPLNKFWEKLDKIGENSGATYIFNIQGDDPKQIAKEVEKILVTKTNRGRLAWQ